MMPTAEANNPEVTTAKALQLEIAVNRDALLAELSFAQSVAETKTTIPILSSILLEVGENGVTITATDLDRSIVTSVPAKIRRPGAVAIPARKLYDYTKLLPSGVELTIKALENNWVQIRAGRSNTKMVALGRSNFPCLNTIGNQAMFKLPVGTMKLLLSQSAFAVSREESRYTLNGALFGLEPEKLYMVATDGHRLSVAEKSEHIAGLSDNLSILVPKRAIEDLQNLLAATEESELAFSNDDKTLLFVVGHRRYTCRRLSGQFPNYAAVIPTANDKSFVVGVAQFEQAIRRVATFADERSGAVKLSVDGNTLTFSAASTENGESEESVETHYEKESLAIGFNSAYILDFLKILRSKGEVRIDLKDAQSSALFRPEGADLEMDIKYVVMPLRV